MPDRVANGELARVLRESVGNRHQLSVLDLRLVLGERFVTGENAEETRELVTDYLFRVYDRLLIDICVEYDGRPPSTPTNAGRHILKRLCEETGIELNEKRRVPDASWCPTRCWRGSHARTSGHTATARVLNNSEGTVREYYSYIEASKLADQMIRAQRG